MAFDRVLTPESASFAGVWLDFLTPWHSRTPRNASWTDFRLRDRRDRRLWGNRNGRLAQRSRGRHAERATSARGQRVSGPLATFALLRGAPAPKKGALSPPAPVSCGADAWGEAGTARPAPQRVVPGSQPTQCSTLGLARGSAPSNPRPGGTPPCPPSSPPLPSPSAGNLEPGSHPGLPRATDPPGQVTRPVVHQDTPALEQVRASIGRLDPVADHMRQGRLDHFSGMIRLFGRPVPEAGSEPVRHRRNPLLADRPPQLLVIERLPLPAGEHQRTGSLAQSPCRFENLQRSPTDDQALNPTAGSAGLDEEVQSVSIGVSSGRSGALEGSREDVAGVAVGGFGFRSGRSEVRYSIYPPILWGMAMDFRGRW